MFLKKSQEILTISFFQLLLIYFTFVFLISTTLIDEYTLQFTIFALLLGLFSILIKFKKETYSFAVNNWMLLFPIVFLVIMRLLPFIGNTIPLGYDPGLYKSLFEHNVGNLLQGTWSETQWAKEGFPPGISLLMTPFYALGIPSDVIITYFLIVFEIFLIIALYFLVKEFFSKEVAFISTILFAFSIISFQTFYLNYFKNIPGILFMLLTFYCFKKEKYILGTVLGGFLGGLHRPSFALFGLIFFFNWLFLQRTKKMFYSGIGMVVLASLFYIDRFDVAVLPILQYSFDSVVSSSTGSGTFLTLKQTMYASLVFLPLFLIGLVQRVKEKKFDIFFIWAVINGAIVVFELFFYNRMIIFFNIVLVVYAAYGFMLVISSLQNVMRVTMPVLIGLSLVISGMAYSYSADPLISEAEFDALKWIPENTPENAWVFSVNKYYSTWIEGWAYREVVAPGLFDNDRWDKSTWNRFWSGEFSLIEEYDGPKYIYIGRFNEFDASLLVEDNCTNVVFENSDAKVLEYVC